VGGGKGGLDRAVAADPWRYWVMKKVELTSAPMKRKRAA
jgi:hypothetical protein